MMKKTILFTALIVIASVGSLTSCTGGVGYEGSYAVTVASDAPPSPYDEEIGIAPGGDYVWVAGYWWWDGGRYVWVRGRWAVPPTSGYVWVRSGWVLHDNQYHYVYGRWSAPSRVVRPSYVHPAGRHRVVPGSRYRSVRRR